ncbi:HK97 gp10 family phage protein [Lachnospiraceae bacterium 45-P1]|jgi:hypothetical protein|uniref:hypothetical protein n=1 Tax=uncultured Phocaeicola sp. TaxID=990718 RepID=UPI00260C4968|nr:hypothetical protein [uncultured Phocaeicola sp.]
MSGITFRHKGDFSKTEKFFNSLLKLDYLNVLERYGQAGVAALASATPKDSGLTAASWDYEITHNGKETTIAFTNSNISNGVNIAIILQYGHGTKGGGYVAGRDYINPAIQPIFDKMANEAWREVTNL